jgi:BASS family bile acid:Na+ symporter
MNLLTRILDFAGRRGPTVLCIGVLLGLAAPPLADAARPAMGFAVFVFTLGAFLKVSRGDLVSPMSRPGRLAILLAWTTFGVPAVAIGLARVLPVPAEVTQGFLICMFAPPVGSAAAIAAMLGMSPALALLATIVATLLAPLYLPALASLAGSVQLQMDASQMTLRLALIVGAAAAVAVVLRRYAGGFVQRHPQAMTGLAVTGLLLVALGAMRGMREVMLVQPVHVVGLLLLAFAVNAGFQLLGAMLFAGWSRKDAVTVGLVSGNRNVTLTWVMAAPALVGHPGVELYIALSVFPIFMMPALSKRLLQWYVGSTPAPLQGAVSARREAA